jgi:alpha-galactosidase
MAGSAKVSLIGAGSIEFGRELLGDVLSYKWPRKVVLSMMDIDPDRLDLMAKLGARMVAESGKNVEIETTQRRKDTLENADYVITTIHVGGLEAYEKDIKIPMKYGVDQNIGDTLGPGGVFRAARNIPILVEIGRDIERICPDAWWLQYSNPMAMNIWAVRRAVPKVKLVGLCHSIPNTAERMAEFIGAPSKEIGYLAAGVNHMAWFLKFEWKGKNAYPRLREAMKKKEIYGKDPIRFDLLKAFDYFVSESSGHASEYYPYFRKRKELVEKFVKDYTTPDADWHDWGRGGGNLRRSIEETKTLRERISNEISGKGRIRIEASGEYSIRVIRTFETKQSLEIYANILNSGLITNLPEGCCVEVPCDVRNNKITPRAIGNLPPQLAALCRSAVNVQDLAVQGSLTKNRKLIRQAIALDPLTSAVLSLDEIRQMVDEMFKEEARWLQGFAG